MKFSLIFILGFVLFQSALVNAQDSGTQGNTCFEPFSQKFDEFTFTTADEAKNHLKAFENSFKEKPAEAKGYILVYGGNKTHINEIPDIIAAVRQVLNITDNSYNSKFQVRDSGYRLAPTIALFISPLECSQYPDSSSDFTVDQVEFSELTSENTIRKTAPDINASLIKKTEPLCAPASRAIHVCNNPVEVFIIIDPKGNVIFAKAVSGHPLLRIAAEETVKNWKFQPTKTGNKFYNAAGLMTIQFKEPEGTTNH